ncbi:MAG: SAM-dependent methyltransferase, partial [archaeon]|nr:SAM-dependent methyltransferase [archaeon]
VPGVSSSIAVPELVGIPVTHRDYASSVTILTGHNKFGGAGVDWASAARVGGTLVIMMGMGNAATISKKLMDNGKSPQTKVAVISSGTRLEQCTITTTLDKLVEAICENNLKAPGIIVVGDAVSERIKLGDLC